MGTHASTGVSSGDVDTQSTKLLTVSGADTNEQDNTVRFKKDEHGVVSTNENSIDSTVATAE